MHTFWNSNFVKIQPDLIKSLSVSLNISDSWCPLCSCLQMRWPNSSFMWTNWATRRSQITSILKTCGAVLSGEDLICPSHRELQGNRPPKILEPRKRWGLKTCEMVWKKFGTTDIFSFMHWNPVNPPSSSSRYLASYWNVGSVGHLSIAAHFLSGCGHFTGTGVFQDDNARIRQADYESMIHHHRLLALTPVGIFVMWWSDYSHHWLALLKMFLVHRRITTMTQKLRIHQKN